MLTNFTQITVAMLVGIILGPHVLDLVKTDKIAGSEILVQEVSRLVIGIQLMAIALKYVSYSGLTRTYTLAVFHITISAKRG
jgi:hypothetical protein